MGAKSVSLPTLGHGRLFKFPTKCISQIMIDTVHSYVKSNQVQINVVNVTYDQEMLDSLAAVACQSLEAYSSDTLEISYTSDDESVVNPDKKKILDLVTSGDLEISVTMAKVDEPKKTLQKLTDLIKRKCLYTVQFEHMMISVLELEIEEKAKNQLVLIRKSTVAETGDRKIVIKGFIEHVKEIKQFITVEISNFQSAMKNKSLSATDAPSRGTKDFLHYAANVTEICPSYWTFCKKPSYLKRLLGTRKFKFLCKESRHEIIVPVDKETKKSIIDVFEKTWDPSKSGVGKDARGLSEGTKCEVLNVERIENPALFELYAQTRKNLFEKYGALEKLCDDFSKTLPRGQVKTTEILPSTLKEQLYYEVNEHYFFHGTKKSLIEALCQHGPDPKLCTNAMLGNGLYMGEESLKSDQYTDEKEQRTAPGEELKMFLMRALLGNTYVITRDHERMQRAFLNSKLKRPPCAKCQSDLCANVSHLHCDSVTLDGSPDDMRVCFREFVVYDKSMCYPEYIITYRRKR